MAAPSASSSGAARPSKNGECSARSSRAATALGLARGLARLSVVATHPRPNHDTVHVCAGGTIQFGGRWRMHSDRPWLRAYDAGVPAEIEIPDRPLDSFLSASAARVPSRDAIRFFGRSLTYSELDGLVSRFAN